MNNEQPSQQVRALSISFSSRGFGYAVMEGENRLVNYGKKTITQDKNRRALGYIEKMISRYQPDVLVLQDVNAKDTYRHPRIKKLHRDAVALAKKHKIKVFKISGKELRKALLGNEEGTKHEMAELLAKWFPDELAARLPPKRKFYKSEDARMDIFEAVGLVVALKTT